MKRRAATLENERRGGLAGVTRKGPHQSRQALNAPLPLNCGEGKGDLMIRQRRSASRDILRGETAARQASRCRIQAKRNGGSARTAPL